MFKLLKKINLKSPLISGAIFLTGLLNPLNTLALPEREVMAKLENIPLFAITNNQGQLNSYLFVNPQQAFSTLGELQNREPQRAVNLRVRPISLSTVYRGLQTIQNQNTALPQLIVPDQNSLNRATTLMRANGQSVNDPRTIGIPLFVATIGRDRDERWLVATNRRTNQLYIPFYFDKTEADQIVEVYRRENPNETDPVQVRVYSLGYIVGLLLGNNNEATQMMEIVPSVEQINEANRLLNP
jgi:hypothetical protein